MDYKLEHFKKHNDARGQLVVFLGSSDLAQTYKQFGQIYFVTFAEIGIVRGNHYHKQWREWFGVVSGQLHVVLRDVNTDETAELFLDGDSDEYTRLEIGPYIAHAFKSITPKAALLNYSNAEWSSEDSIPCELVN